MDNINLQQIYKFTIYKYKNYFSLYLYVISSHHAIYFIKDFYLIDISDKEQKRK